MRAVRDQVDQRPRVQARSREHELRSRERREIRHAPSVDVKHGHDGHHGVRLADAESVDETRAEGVQYGRPVREEHALRLARRCRRVTQDRRGALVELGPRERFRLRREHRIVVARAARRHARIGRAHDDERRRAVGKQREGARDGRDERRIDEDESVVRMLERTRDLLRKEPDVRRV